MEYIKSLIAARWFPYALTGLLASVGAVSGYSYMKGYGAAKSHYQEQMNLALSKQLQAVVKQKDYEMQLALSAERKKNAITQQVNAVKAPTVSCDLPSPCVQWYDNILRATQPD